MNSLTKFNILILLILLKITRNMSPSKVEIFRQKMEKNGEKIQNISILAFNRRTVGCKFSRLMKEVNGVKTPYGH
jgi:hypothetical protein